MNDFNNEDKLLKEKLLLNGFKLAAVEDFNKLPPDKDAFLLKTNQKQLRRGLQKWASDNDAIILMNSTELSYEQGKRIFAFVVDEEFKNQFNNMHKITEKFISGNADLESIQDFLEIQQQNNGRV